MLAGHPNVFIQLHRWASGHDENFCTESLAYVIAVLLEYEPQHGLDVVKFLTGDRAPWGRDDARHIRLVTQTRMAGDQPDLWIEGRGHLVLVEAKVEQPPTAGQLRRYRELLQKRIAARRIRSGTLVFLTRFTELQGLDDSSDVSRQWFEVSDHLENLRLQDRVAAHVQTEFLRFLRMRRLAMERVNEDMVPGIHSMLSLLDMARETMRRLDIRTANNTGSSEMIGFEVPDLAMYVAVAFERPGALHVQAKGLDIAAACERGGEGDRWGQWVHGIPLEDSGFFERPKNEQLEYLREELEKRIEVVRATRPTA